MSSPSASLQPGVLLAGRYRLKLPIGAGGMGYVYQAEDIELGRRVAVKVLYEDMQPQHLDRLFGEALASARIDHPAVVTTYQYGTDSDLDVSYVVMQYLQGETVAKRIERVGPLPLPLVLRIALEIADALAAAHAAGVIHRDIKPSNVFLATRGRHVDEVKLIDFGVAKQLDQQTLTATGEVIGTPRYMAPEQFENTKHVDHRCDLYAFGVLVWECLAGRALFASDTWPALVSEIRFGPEPDVRALGRPIPEALSQVIERCLKKRACDRFPDAASIVTALSGSDA